MAEEITPGVQHKYEMKGTPGERPIKVGDRFEDLDWRNEGRIIEIREPANAYGKYRAQVEVHPNNPSAVGRHVSLLGTTIRNRFRRLSR